MAGLTMTASEKSNKYQPLDDQFLHSAAIIDANGREVAITAEMIDQACDKLAKQFEQFQRPPSNNR
jgi:hypothetical protein